MSLFERLSKYIHHGTSCWIWTGNKTYFGYGRVRFGKKSAVAHRVIYTMCVGPIPKGYTLDHLCRTPPCVNPLHLQPISIADNVLRGEGAPAINRRKTHCINGHALSGSNLRISADEKKRICRKCEKAYFKTRRKII